MRAERTTIIDRIGVTPFVALAIVVVAALIAGWNIVLQYQEAMAGAEAQLAALARAAGNQADSTFDNIDSLLQDIAVLNRDGPVAGEDFSRTLARRAKPFDPVVGLSVVEPNTFGVAWFDGVTPMLPPSQWTHVWELGFESAEAYDAYQKGASALARAEAAGWKGDGTGAVRQAVELHYAVHL